MMQKSSSMGQAPWVVESNRPPVGWPQHGEVEFRNYSVRYRPGLDLVLQDLSLHVAGGEKVCGVWVLALWWLGSCWSCSALAGQHYSSSLYPQDLP